jgi:hypothetical protein
VGGKSQNPRNFPVFIDSSFSLPLACEKVKRGVKMSNSPFSFTFFLPPGGGEARRGSCFFSFPSLSPSPLERAGERLLFWLLPV